MGDLFCQALDLLYLIILKRDIDVTFCSGRLRCCFFSFQYVLTTDLCYSSPLFSHLKMALTHFRWCRNLKFLIVSREAHLFYSWESISHHSRQPRKASFLKKKKKSFSTLWSSTLNVKMRWFECFGFFLTNHSKNLGHCGLKYTISAAGTVCPVQKKCSKIS